MHPMKLRIAGDDAKEKPHRLIGIRQNHEAHYRGWRRGTESNRRMGLLQSPALPLGYPAITIGEGKA